MKVLHIDLTEYDSFEDLDMAFKTMPIELKKNGAILVESKRKAVRNLEYQHHYFKDSMARVFWWSNDKNSFILHETIYD